MAATKGGARPAAAPVDHTSVRVFRIPTETPESDGTLAWNVTTLVLAAVGSGGHTGLGYTYSTKAAAAVMHDHLFPVLAGHDALDIQAAWKRMADTLRNLGHTGIGGQALSAVDCALWDLKARLLARSLSDLLGRARASVPVYGSGGFTSYPPAQLAEQLGNWVTQGMGAVKMKVGRTPLKDVERVRIARRAIGDTPGLFVDANGAYDRKQAVAFAHAFHEYGVSWFEEPVSSDDTAGLRLIGEQVPAPMEVTAGEYIGDLFDAQRLIDEARVDVLQADVTRCGGVTQFLRIDALCQSCCLPLSSHTAPSLHLPVCAAAAQIRHMEYFHDHARIEHMLFEGCAKPESGVLTPDSGGHGFGLSVKEADARAYELT